MTTFDSIRLITARELRVKLRDKAFLFSTGFFLVFALGSAILPAMLGGGPSSVAVSRPDTAAALSAAGLEVRTAADDRAAQQLVRDGEVDAAVGEGNVVYAMTDAPDDVVGALSVRPQVQLLDPNAVEPGLAFLIPFVFAFIFFFTSLTFGLQIAQSVTEEKQTRLVEILVATVPVRVLLAGKVLAGVLLAAGQIALIVVGVLVGVRVAGTDTTLVSLLAPAIGWFVPFFLFGFLMLAGLWAAVGALVNRQEDISGASTPMQILVLIPFFAVAFFNGNPAALTALSYIPFSAPTAMPVRIFNGDAAVWEPVVSLGILVATAFVAVVVAARLYEGSLLHSRGRMSIAAAWRDREARRLAKQEG